MINNYPLSSFELNDKIFSAHENLVYLIGVETDVGVYSGVYDFLEYSGVAMMDAGTTVGDSSTVWVTPGIPHIAINEEVLGLSDRKSSEDLIKCLKYDYIFKKYYNFGR